MFPIFTVTFPPDGCVPFDKDLRIGRDMHWSARDGPAIARREGEEISPPGRQTIACPRAPNAMLYLTRRKSVVGQVRTNGTAILRVRTWAYS